MKILITGANGFVGKNLTEALKNVRDGKDRMRPELSVDELFLYDIDTPANMLDEYAAKADFVFHLAGVNRPKDNKEFREGNFGFSSMLLDCLKKYGNKCPVMLSSSVQASLCGKYAGSEYGKSKKAGEELFFAYEKEIGAKVYVYRFPNIFGKWCKPNYNSAVATFCYNIANDLPIRIDNRETELELLYIDDLIDAMFDLLEGKMERCDYAGTDPIPEKCGKYCYVPITHRAKLGAVTDLLQSFRTQPETLLVPFIPDGSFEKKLYSTYLSYLPADKTKFAPITKTDARGSFTEIIKTLGGGQFSVNVSKPGVTKGEHWHNSKWEMFIVVSGHALIQERNIGTDEIREFEVSGEKTEAVYMLPGYTHNIINLSQTENLVTLMWANEVFDSNRPDTFSEKVVND